MDIPVDEFDRRLLRALQHDATQSMDRLAERVGLSRNACWRRVKRLEAEGIITRRVAILDPGKIGLPLAVMVMIRTNRHDREWLAAFDRAVRSLPAVVGACRMSGDLDYVLHVRVADMAGYDAFYQRLIGMVPVSDVSASFVMENIKDGITLPV